MLNNKYINQLKLDKIKQIENNYKYIYLFRYNDLNYNEIIVLKKEMKKLNLNFLIFKQNLIKQIFPNLKIKGQGPLIIIYSNDIIKINIIQKLKKMEFITLMNENNIYSKLKINNICGQEAIPLPYQIKKNFYSFLYSLRNISL